jgi:hypothetical protein
MVFCSFDPIYIHCEKSLFVLASRQKIPVFRTENPVVDTSSVCLLPIEFFLITHARKATARKSRPETTDSAGKSQPSGARKGKARKSPASNYRYGRKIRLPVTADTAGKSRQVTTRYGRKIRFPVTTETAHMPKTFFALCKNLVNDIQSGYRKLTSSLVTV